MSFLKKSIHNKSYNRKEQDSLWTTQFRQFLILKTERTSAFASKGSLTIEAAIVVPIFFFTMLCLVALLEMVSIRMTVQGALHSVAKEYGQQAYVSSVLIPYGVEQRIVKQIGKDKLERSMIVNGVNGFDCSGSTSDDESAELELHVDYKLQVPVLLFRIPIVSCHEEVKTKGWTGYLSKGTGNEEGEVVYVAQHGTVYHKDMYCKFLNTSVRGIIAGTIGDARNNSGGKYYPCESCKELEHFGFFYVSSYGDRYHTSLNCKKIKRNYYAIPLKDAEGLGGCSKCVQ